jgi:glycosyltransferase involved in cell wall biosynthesis
LSLVNFSNKVNEVLSRKKFDLIHLYAFRGSSYIKMRSVKNNKWLFHLITGNVSRGVKSNLANHLTKFESRFFDQIIANTNNVGKWVLGSDEFAEIPPGVDFKRFKPFLNIRLREELGFSNQDLVLIYSGSLSPLRNLGVLLEGFKIALKQCNKLKLLIIGSGETDYISRKTRIMKIEDQVKIIGYVPYLQVHEYISVADVGLAYVPITPEYIPQPALKTLEMLSCGKPVVATATDGNKEFISDKFNGVLVDDTPQMIANGLLKVVNDKIFMNRLGVAARKSVEKYDWARIVSNQLVPVYKEMINK